tara:strand:- start:10749 stop:11120 length:372 start_codon:yes stop_codon:yes gene_type:complete
MSRIQVNLEKPSLARLDDIAGELTKGDDTLRQSRRREMAVEYLIEAVSKAHEVVISQKNQIHAANMRISDLSEGHKADTEAMEASLEKYKDKVSLLSYEGEKKSEALSCLRQAIHHLTEPSDG